VSQLGNVSRDGFTKLGDLELTSARMPGDRGSWVEDELAYAGRENLDPAHVARYDGKMDGDAGAELAALRATGLGEDATVIDLGAGTGQFTLAAAAVVRKVVAVDVSPPMLERLRAKLRSRGVDNVECVAGGFLTYEHDAEPADLVYSRLALHHLPDFWKARALVRAADMLKPGGTLRLSDVVYGFEPAEAESCLEHWISQMASESAEGGWTRAELEEHVRDEHSTFTWLLEPMLEKAGFAIEEADYSEDRIFARYRCVKGGSEPNR
jgi:SAM-dependent methyltransferase